MQGSHLTQGPTFLGRSDTLRSCWDLRWSLNSEIVLGKNSAAGQSCHLEVKVADGNQFNVGLCGGIQQQDRSENRFKNQPKKLCLLWADMGSHACSTFKYREGRPEYPEAVPLWDFQANHTGKQLGIWLCHLVLYHCLLSLKFKRCITKSKNKTIHNIFQEIHRNTKNFILTHV